MVMSRGAGRDSRLKRLSCRRAKDGELEDSRFRVALGLSARSRRHHLPGTINIPDVVCVGVEEGLYMRIFHGDCI